MHCFDNALRPPSLRRRNCLRVQNARVHARGRVKKPCPQMADRVLCIPSLVREYKGGGKCRDPDTEIKQSVAMSSESVGVRGAAAVDNIGASGVGGVGPVVAGFGVVVVWSAGTARAGQRCEGIELLLEVGVSLSEDAVVINGSNVG